MVFTTLVPKRPRTPKAKAKLTRACARDVDDGGGVSTCRACAAKWSKPATASTRLAHGTPPPVPAKSAPVSLRGPAHLSDGDTGVPDRDRKLVAQVWGEKSRKVHPADELTVTVRMVAMESGDDD